MHNMFLLFSILFSLSLFAGEPIKIGTSNHPEATAFNNAHKIVRTSDDKRVVVFQDMVDDTNVIKMTKSEDEITWTEPKILANGYNPAIAVSKSDSFYVIWEDSDELALMLLACGYTEFESTSEFKLQAVGKDALGQDYRTLDIAGDYIVWTSNWNGDVSVNVGLKNLDRFQHSYVTLGNTGKCGRPSLVTDIEHQGDDSFSVLWEEEYQGEKALFGFWTYASELLEISGEVIDESFVDGRGILYKIPDSENYSNPSHSYRWIHDGEILIIGAWHSDDSVVTGYLSIPLEWTDYRESDGYEYRTFEIPCWNYAMPVVDDVYMGPPSSTAILWQDGGQIKYGQANQAEIDSVFTISGSDVARYPSVCYKQFRADYFDAVWMEWNGDGYDIIYRRFEKYYGKDTFEILTTELPDAIVGQDYTCAFSVNHDDFRAWIIAGHAPENLEIVNIPPLGGFVWIYPPTTAGVYSFTVAVGPNLPYLVPALADTAEFTLTIKNGMVVENQFAPIEFALHPNYPNPFNPSTQMQYDLPETADVLISIYNVNGKLVETLVQENQAAGSHKITWQAKDLPSGTFFIRMRAGEFEQTRKCLLIR